MKTKTAIVTSYRGAAPILDSFLRYHLALGFDHVFLFFDDPEDPGMETARRYPAVVVVPNDEELRRRWRETELYRTRTEWVEKHLHREVMTRQVLNVDVAVGMALEMGIDWLLHIDVDELFYCPGTSVAEHFRGLSEQGCAAMRYLNYEAVPERMDVVDCFREVTLFKQHRRFLPGEEFSEEQRKVIESIPNCPGRLFHFYGNGKSAGRVAPGLRARGVHDFSFPPERPESLRVGRASDPTILHYPCCTFEVFWEKYRVLGRFDDRWPGNGSLRYPDVSTHRDSRDVVLQGDRELAEAFYRERYLLREEDAARLVEHGLALYIRGPSELLAEPGPAGALPPARGPALAALALP